MTSLKKELIQFKNSSFITDEELDDCNTMLTTLKKKRCFFRDCFPNHFTASGWILNESKSAVLLMHHRKLNLWLQPGGHADGNEKLIEVVKKEIKEETGLSQLTLLHPEIFDCDIHKIPPFKEIPSHNHLDIRYLFNSSSKENIKKNSESHALQWVPFNEVSKFNKNRSILRMLEKSHTICLNK